MKKTILQYMTDIYQEDIPKHILQENKIRLNSFFLEQESVQKKGTQFIFRYAFYSVEKPRKITKQHLLKEYAGVPLEKRSVQPEQIPDMKQYSDIILYGDASSPEAQQQLAEYLQQHNSLKVQLSFFDKRNDSTSKDEQAIAYAELQKALFFCQRKKIPSNPQPIGFSGILLAKRQNSFYCTYFLHNRNVADTKSPYPIKRLEVIRWFNQKSMVFNQSLS